MTGTSCDGLDAVCIELDGESWSFLWSEQASYPPALRREVLAIQELDRKWAVADWLNLHGKLGEWYGRTLNRLLRKHSAGPHVIANHGQTLAHLPGIRETLQAGDPSRIAVETGLTVISHFREGDLAAGGQGAPLAPIFHQILGDSLKSSKGLNTHGIAFQNIGGIANTTYLGKNGSLMAFDSGPGNFWIDLLAEKRSKGAQKMDKNGKWALAGEPDLKVLKELMSLPYFRRSPPKSCGRADFPISLFNQAIKKAGTASGNVIATATAFTVDSIATAYEQFILRKKLPLSHVILCGGGAKNPAVLTGLKNRLPSMEIMTLDELGLDSQLVEAQAVAFWGFLCLMGYPLGGAWTGAKGYGPPGHIVPGENWKEVLERLRAI